MVRLVVQRGPKDCGIAALATLLSASSDYEDVFLAAAAVERLKNGRAGLRNRELQAIARKLGLPLEATKAFDLDADCGVLRVYGRHTNRGGHWVAVRYGLLWDPAPDQACAAPWREYASRHDVRFGTLLRATGAEGD